MRLRAGYHGRKRAEARHAALEQQLRHAQKIEAVGELASGVAHEFNNLLLIIGEGVERGQPFAVTNPKLRDALHLIAQAADDAEGVIRSLLAFGHQVALDRRPIELRALVSDICQVLKRMFPAAIELNVDTPDEDSMWIHGDGTQLRQIVMNLALNARDAMPDGGRLDITVRPTLPDDWASIGAPPEEGRSFVSLIARDTGRGMDEEQRSRIFEPFFTTKTRTSGTGLGLAVVHGIIRDHKGFITVRSDVGHGSTFTVILPRVDASTTDAVEDTSVHSLNGAGKRVLLAEDHTTVCDVIRSSMEHLGYDVIVARDGLKAMEVYRKEGAGLDAIILDIDLPRRNGLSCLDQIRTRDTQCPVILITGDPTAAIRKALDTYTVLLRKPFRTSELTTLVHRMLQAR